MFALEREREREKEIMSNDELLREKLGFLTYTYENESILFIHLMSIYYALSL